MRSLSGFWSKAVVALVTVGFLALPGSAIATESGGGGLIPMDECPTVGESGVIGSVSVDPGEPASVPVYITSDNFGNVVGFHFEFDVAAYGGLKFAGVTPGPDMDPATPIDTFTVGNSLVVELTQTGLISVPADGVDPFIYLEFTTCYSNAETNPIQWITGESWIFADPCLNDDLDQESNGSVDLSTVTFDVEVGDVEGLLGEEVWVPVIVDNSVDFSYFYVGVYIQTDSIQFVRVEPTSRTDDSELLSVQQGSVFYGYQANEEGFGDPSVQDTLFYFVFKVLTEVDDWNTLVYLIPAPNFVNFYRMGCNTDFGSLATITYDDGSVTVPEYTVTFSAGSTSGGAGCPLSVPLLVETNFPIYHFQLLVGYNEDLGNQPLDFTLAGNLMYGIGVSDKTCASSGIRYLEISNDVGNVIPPTDDPVQVATLNFGNNWAPDETIEYVLHGLNDVCPELLIDTTSATAAKINGAGYGPIGLVVDYTDGDPNSPFQWTDGTITVDGSLVHVSVPSALAPWCKFPPCTQNWAATSMNVWAETDLDDLSFRVTWNSNVCAKFYSLAPGVSVQKHSTYADVTVGSVTGTGGWQTLGTVKFYNNSGGTQTGPIAVVNLDATPSDPCVDPALIATGGTYRVYGGVSTACFTPPDLCVASVPEEFSLSQNRPNPFNASTVIEFTIPEASHTKLEIFNVMGQRVRNLMDAFTEAGAYSILWDGTTQDGRTTASGMYFYRLTAGAHVETKKMVVIK